MRAASTTSGVQPNQQTPGVFQTFRALRHRDFRLLWVGLAVSAIGTWMQIVAQSLLVLKMTHGSAFALGTVSLAQALAFFLFALVGGSVADRLDKRQLLIFTQSGAAALAILLGFLTLFGVIRLWMVLVLAFLNGTLLSFDQPARGALVPVLVPKEDIGNAISLQAMLFNGASTLGPALAGFGEFPDGARTLRAKIDMASPNFNMRDPIMYRILRAEHHRTGNQWCIYPMYDYTHGQSDSIEGITHSICTLEFEDHRPLYDWYVEALGIYHPQQIEFDRLNVTYTLLSKRKLLTLVQDGHVRGWDDPRMPTLAGIRRRGYPPEALRSFCGAIGVSKTNGSIELGLLEHHVRENLNRTTPRAMAVLRPLRVVIDNYPEGRTEEMEAVNNPEDATAGTRQVPFSKVLYIEQDDFREVPPDRKSVV